ncbi:uncharacterized protein EDB91DRAFT_1252337 [Suillus paluster]|uniref:uncharacterized protein n=1 Tax=Suillus paluster TaxID=48578 RepID=UPI001B8797BA|nr:uncharacterized protein EDB91DRAFT_1252337 [Suillus paluster]KAG1731085.1 hypothetical protein EDB91DRAFT_1252337 [Suillus paluster]
MFTGGIGGARIWYMTVVCFVTDVPQHQSTEQNPHATIDEPLMFNHFMKDKAIKPMRPPPHSLMPAFGAYHAYLNGHDYNSGTNNSGLTCANPGDGGLSSTLEHNMHPQSSPAFFSQRPLLPPPGSPAQYYHPSFYQYPYQYYPLSAPLHPVQPPAAPSAQPSPLEYPSPGVTTKHSVMLESFCSKFLVSPSDSKKLKADWISVGFTVLGWCTFLSHHRKFCDAIITGTWV